MQPWGCPSLLGLSAVSVEQCPMGLHPAQMEVVVAPWPHVPPGGTQHPPSIPIKGATLSSSTHLNYKSRKWKQWSCIQPVLPQGLASVVDGTKCFLEKKKYICERNIVLKGFFYIRFAGGVLLLGWVFYLIWKVGATAHVWTCQRFDVCICWCRVLTETFAFFFSPSLSAMAHEHVHVRLWWSKCPDPRTY